MRVDSLPPSRPGAAGRGRRLPCRSQEPSIARSLRLLRVDGLGLKLPRGLKLIRFAEHKTDSDDVYFLLYGGRERFTDVSKHPNKLIKAWGRQSTAAGDPFPSKSSHTITYALTRLTAATI